MNSSKSVLLWLFIGLIMVFVQVVVGGITRLTESGLSITKWEVVSGSIPPLSDVDWKEEFDLYKLTPQYEEINEGMTISQFKFIYFWEYIHRFWARIMGFVFIIPFFIFLRKKMLSPSLLRNLGVVVVLALLAAVFGWIMVASGLIERPWVNAYKLSIHLSIAFAVFGFLQWTYLSEKYKNLSWVEIDRRLKILLFIFCSAYIIQLFLGGMMSGMKVAVVYPSWPKMNNEWIPSAIQNASEWNLQNLTNYDTNEFAPAFVHFMHRGTAYILLIVFIFLWFKNLKDKKGLAEKSTNGNNLNMLGVVLLIQVIIGICTVLTSIGKVPLLGGVLHQVGALCLLASIIYYIFTLKKKEL
ncbi:MAG: COX15/CtaA family protein [Saprospiraceae bacterium]